MRWLSLDPGTRYTGYALWDGSKLLGWGMMAPYDPKAEWYSRSQDVADQVAALADELRVKLVISEFPQEMHGGRGEVALKSGSVRKLAAYVGMLEGRIGNHHRAFKIVEPITWKGQLPKEITTKRVLRDYPQVPRGLRSDIYDAIGIGRWRIRELRRKEA